MKNKSTNDNFSKEVNKLDPKKKFEKMFSKYCS